MPVSRRTNNDFIEVILYCPLQIIVVNCQASSIYWLCGLCGGIASPNEEQMEYICPPLPIPISQHRSSTDLCCSRAWKTDFSSRSGCQLLY